VSEVAIGASATRPVWLPDGRRFLYEQWSSNRWSVILASFDGQSPTVIVDEEADPSSRSFAYSTGGYLFINRNETLFVQRFDAQAGRPADPLVAVAGRAGRPNGWADYRRPDIRWLRSSRSRQQNQGCPGTHPRSSDGWIVPGAWSGNWGRVGAPGRCACHPMAVGQS
jgi:hypothetical protein